MKIMLVSQEGGSYWVQEHPVGLTNVWDVAGLRATLASRRPRDAPTATPEPVTLPALTLPGVPAPISMATLSDEASSSSGHETPFAFDGEHTDAVKCDDATTELDASPSWTDEDRTDIYASCLPSHFVVGPLD